MAQVGRANLDTRVRPDEAPPREGAQRRPEAVAWRSYGFAAGAMGAAGVALVFLLVDLAAGRPLWTPAALGSVLFTGKRLVAAGFDPWAHLALIAGYTAIHGAVFVGYGTCASFFLMTAERLPRSLALVAVLTAGALFLLFELTFLAQALVFEPAPIGDLGAGWVAVANACAALVMGVFLARNAGPRAPRAYLSRTED